MLPDRRLRQLSVDDLYLLVYILEGKLLVEAARLLQLSQAAISQRITKITNSTGVDIFESRHHNSRVNRTLTKDGAELCRLALEAVKLLHSLYPDKLEPLVNEPQKTHKRVKRKYERKNNCGYLGPNI